MAVSWLLTLACGRAEPSLPPEPATTRDGRWAQDIVYVSDNLARLHLDAFRFVSKEDYETARDELLERIPGLSDVAIITHLAALVARLRDAHSSLPLPLGSADFPLAPCVVEWVPEGYVLTAAPLEFEFLLEARVVRVGEVPIDEAIRRLGVAVSHENEIGLRVETLPLLRVPAVQHALGLSSRADAVQLGLETENGIRTVTFEVSQTGSVPELARIRPVAKSLTWQRRDESYWYEVLPERHALYLAYNACYEDAGRPFEEFAAEVLAHLENPDIERLVIDLRRNRGGSQIVAWPLLKALKGHRLDRPGGILVLIGSKTFSSAKGNALDLRDWTHAVLLGEPTRQRPNSFGEIKSFKSPNHGLAVSYSTKYFARASENEDAVRPDVTVPFLLSQWKQGIDTVFEAALAYEP